MEYINLFPKTTKKSAWKNLEKNWEEEAYGESCENYGIVPPWMEDGFFIYGQKPQPTWQNGVYENMPDHEAHLKTAGLYNTRFTPINRWAADFYLLDAIAAQIPQGKCVTQSFNASTVFDFIEAGVIPETSSRDDLISLRAMYLQERLVRKLYPILRDYLYYAGAGESAYHYAPSYFFSSGNDAWICTAWHLIRERFGDRVTADWLERIFLTGGGGDHWSSSFGGQAWADCMKPLKYLVDGKVGKETFTPKNFVDRAFALQHNGGTVFDKIGWKQDPEYMVYVLNAHHKSDWKTLLANATPLVEDLFKAASSDSEFVWKNTKYPMFNKTGTVKSFSGKMYESDDYGYDGDDDYDEYGGCTCEYCQ